MTQPDTLLRPPAELPARPFDSPLVNPAAIGLYPLVTWQDDTEVTEEGDTAVRFLGEGVYFRSFNYGGADAFGVWDATWCGNVERITVSGTGGTWKYVWNGVDTGNLAFNIAPADLQAAIDGLANVRPGDILVSSPGAGQYLVSHRVTVDTGVDGALLTGTNAGAATQPVLKQGTKPVDGDPFPPMTIWSYGDCDPSAYGQAEAQKRANQNLRLLEPIAAERDFAIRLLADAGTPETRASLTSAIAYLEGIIGETGTVGVIHASAEWASVGKQQQLWTPSGAVIKSTLGHSLAFGGGYVAGLGTTLVATSPVYGWRSDVALRDTIHYQTNEYIALAERSVALGYEEIIGAVTVTTAP